MDGTSRRSFSAQQDGTGLSNRPSSPVSDSRDEQSDVVMDLMERGPSPTCYDDLKQAYVERRTPSTAERIQRLRLGPITDQRPSDLLRLMERILGRSIEGDEIAKEEFVRRLPAQTQLIIRSQADLFTVEQLAQMADRLASVPAMQATSPSFSVTQAEASREDDVVTLASLHQQLAKLTTSNDIIIKAAYKYHNTTFCWHDGMHTHAYAYAPAHARDYAHTNEPNATN